MNIKSILNGAALVLGMVGIFFKSQHWAGADMLMLAGFVILLISAISFTLRDNKEAGTPAVLSYLMVATLVIGILSAVFRTLNWQGGYALGMASGALLLVLSFMLIASKNAPAVSRQFVTVLIVSFTLLMAIFNTLPKRTVPAIAAAPALEVVE